MSEWTEVGGAVCRHRDIGQPPDTAGSGPQLPQLVVMLEGTLERIETLLLLCCQVSTPLLRPCRSGEGWNQLARQFMVYETECLQQMLSSSASTGSGTSVLALAKTRPLVLWY
jgi:hypothetical protein